MNIRPIMRALRACSHGLPARGLGEPGSRLDSISYIFFGPFGKFESRRELEKFFKEAMPVTIGFTIHRLSNPIIEVKGDAAKGIWYCEIPSTHIPTNKAILQQGTYFDEYVKEGNEWKHAKLDLVYSYITEFGEGWGSRVTRS